MAFLFTLEEVKSLLEEPHSCLKSLTSTKRITLPHYYVGDHRQGAKEFLDLGLKRYSETLDGILVAYFDTMIVSHNGCIMDDLPFFSFDIKANFIVFRPHVGSTLKGVVNKLSSDHIGCLVHGHFNASIFKYREAEWNSPHICVGSVVLFEVTSLELYSKIIFIRGKLLEVEEPDSTAFQENDEADLSREDKQVSKPFGSPSSVKKIKIDDDSEGSSDVGSHKISHLDTDRGKIISPVRGAKGKTNELGSSNAKGVTGQLKPQNIMDQVESSSDSDNASSHLEIYDSRNALSSSGHNHAVSPSKKSSCVKSPSKKVQSKDVSEHVLSSESDEDENKKKSTLKDDKKLPTKEKKLPTKEKKLSAEDERLSADDSKSPEKGKNPSTRVRKPTKKQLLKMQEAERLLFASESENLPMKDATAKVPADNEKTPVKEENPPARVRKPIKKQLLKMQETERKSASECSDSESENPSKRDTIVKVPTKDKKTPTKEKKLTKRQLLEMQEIEEAERKFANEDSDSESEILPRKDVAAKVPAVDEKTPAKENKTSTKVRKPTKKQLLKMEETERKSASGSSDSESENPSKKDAAAKVPAADEETPATEKKAPTRVRKPTKKQLLKMQEIERMLVPSESESPSKKDTTVKVPTKDKKTPTKEKKPTKRQLLEMQEIEEAERKFANEDSDSESEKLPRKDVTAKVPAVDEKTPAKEKKAPTRVRKPTKTELLKMQETKRKSASESSDSELENPSKKDAAAKVPAVDEKTPVKEKKAPTRVRKPTKTQLLKMQEIERMLVPSESESPPKKDPTVKVPTKDKKTPTKEKKPTKRQLLEMQEIEEAERKFAAEGSASESENPPKKNTTSKVLAEDKKSLTSGKKTSAKERKTPAKVTTTPAKVTSSTKIQFKSASVCSDSDDSESANSPRKDVTAKLDFGSDVDMAVPSKPGGGNADSENGKSNGRKRKRGSESESNETQAKCVNVGDETPESPSKKVKLIGKEVENTIAVAEKTASPTKMASKSRAAAGKKTAAVKGTVKSGSDLAVNSKEELAVSRISEMAELEVNDKKKPGGEESSDLKKRKKHKKEKKMKKKKKKDGDRSKDEKSKKKSSRKEKKEGSEKKRKESSKKKRKEGSEKKRKEGSEKKRKEGSEKKRKEKSSTEKHRKKSVKSSHDLE